MPNGNICHACFAAFDSVAHFPTNCPCGKYSVCVECREQLRKGYVYFITACCGRGADDFSEDQTFTKMVQEHKNPKAAPVVDNIETGTVVPKCPENDGQKQSGVQNYPSAALKEIQEQQSLRLIKSIEEQRLLKASKNEEIPKSENLKFNQGLGGLKADNAALEGNWALAETFMALSKAQAESSAVFDPVTNSLANQSVQTGKNEELEKNQKKLEAMERLNMKLSERIVELEKNQGGQGLLLACVECQVLENEKKFSICRTCTKEQSEVDVLDTLSLSEAQLKCLAICHDVCVPQNHKGHEIVDYYPILARINYKTQVFATRIINAKLDKASEKVKEVMENVLKSLEDAKKVANEMTENVGIAKSSEEQKALSDLIKDCYAKILNETEEITQKGGPEFDIGQLLEELKEECKKQRKDLKDGSGSLEGSSKNGQTGIADSKCTKNDSQRKSGVHNNPNMVFDNCYQNFEKESPQFLEQNPDVEEEHVQVLKVHHFVQRHMMEVESQKHSTPLVDNIKTGTAVPKCPENDGQKQSGVQNYPSAALKEIQEQQSLRLIKSIEEQRLLKASKNEEIPKSENLKFNQGLGGLKADNAALEGNWVLVEMLIAISKAQAGSFAAFDPVTNSLADQFGNFGVNANLPSTSAVTQCNDKDSEGGSGSEASFEKI